MNFQTKDSGEREDFSTGARRDTQNDKPRYDLIPPIMLKRLAGLYARGAVKYGENNYQKGIPFSRVYASLFRHLMQYREGDKTEDHLSAVIWNATALMYYEEEIVQGRLPSELNDFEWGQINYQEIEDAINKLECDGPYSIENLPWTQEEHNTAKWNLYVDYDEPSYDLEELAWLDSGCQEAEIVNYHPDYSWVWE